MNCGAEEGDEVCTQKGRTWDWDNKMARKIDGGELGGGEGVTEGTVRLPGREDSDELKTEGEVGV